MYRQSFTRLYSSFGQQRKLFLLVFLWTCLCIVIFKSSLFGIGSSSKQQQQQTNSKQRAEKLHARSATPLYLAPEFALPDNSNNNALYYSLSSSISAAPQSPESAAHVSSDSSANSGAPAKQAANEAGSLGRHADEQTRAAAAEQRQHSEQQQRRRQHENKQHANVAAAPSAASKAHQRQATEQQQSQIPRKHNNEFVVGSQCHYNYPSLFDLQFNNIHWQKMTTKARKQANSTSSATYYLYNAYYDDRWRGGLPSVRILAMIDRIQPPATNCLLWSTTLRADNTSQTENSNLPPDQRRLVPLVTRATFVYAWYPKWGNYKDGLLQPWIVTCQVPRSHVGLVPNSVSLVEVPPELGDDEAGASRGRRDTGAASELANQQQQQQGVASIAMPPSFSSSSMSPSVSQAAQANNRPQSTSSNHKQQQHTAPLVTEAAGADQAPAPPVEYDCKQTLPITNNLPVFNQRPARKEKFAVCVKGLDFPHEDVSVRLVEWIELLNLLGAGKIFLYELDVHENISKVLHYYQERGMVELSPLTLPGSQPNLPEYQHLYLKSKLTAKRQNELIPYNDCLYRNLNSYQYLALLDIDEIIMPLKHHNWYDLMQEVETLSLSEQNYSRASYNVRNVYFFDDLAGPMGTTSSSNSMEGGELPAPNSSSNSDDEDESDNEDEQPQQADSLERGIPHYLHMMQHVYRSKNYTKPGQYVKCFHNTERVVSLHNHFPMNCFGQCTTYSIPVHLAHLQHYRKDCVGPLKQSCKSDFRVFTTRDTTIWKYKQQMIRRTTRVLNHLGLLAPTPGRQKVS